MKKIKEKTKPPIIVVLGHVDHGKSSFLEAVKDLKITQKESGGITQHIGAYFIEHQGKKMTFIDTPGHEAFFAMRSRGASVADIAVLVVAADEGVKQQTKEAIKNIKESGMPFVVAINKIDKKESDPEKVKQALAVEGIFVESLGGKVPSVNISAKSKEGVEGLLEIILLLAEMEDFTCNEDALAEGFVVETRADKRRGLVATLLVKDGTLKKQDIIATESSFGSIKTMEDCSGKKIEEATPSRPVSVTGIKGTPSAGELFKVYKSLEEARENIEEKKKEEREKSETEEFPIIIKADTSGSLGAIESSINSLSREKLMVRIVHSGVGDVSESDVDFAKTTKAEIFTFHVKTDKAAQGMALRDQLKIRSFNIIYEMIDVIKQEGSKRISPETIKTETGRIKVLAVFRTKGSRQVLGGKVIKGEVAKGAKVEMWRGEEKIGDGKIVNLKKEEKDIEKAPQREEIGLLLEGSGRVEENDLLVVYKEEEVVSSL